MKKRSFIEAGVGATLLLSSAVSLAKAQGPSCLEVLIPRGWTATEAAKDFNIPVQKIYDWNQDVREDSRHWLYEGKNLRICVSGIGGNINVVRPGATPTPKPPEINTVLPIEKNSMWKPTLITLADPDANPHHDLDVSLNPFGTSGSEAWYAIPQSEFQDGKYQALLAVALNPRGNITNPDVSVDNSVEIRVYSPNQWGELDAWGQTKGDLPHEKGELHPQRPLPEYQDLGASKAWLGGQFESSYPADRNYWLVYFSRKDQNNKQPVDIIFRAVKKAK